MFIPLISHPRTGSTFLMRLLSQASNLNVAMEPFHPNEQVRQRHIAHLLSGTELNEIEAEHQVGRLTELARTDCQVFLDECKSLVSPNGLALKLFPSHLDTRRLAKVLAGSTHALVLRRNVLHSFLSDVVATRDNAYANVDTSDRLIKFEVEQFRGWVQHHTAFLAGTEAVLKELSVPYSTLHYEQLMRISDTELQMLLEKVGITFDCSLKREQVGLRRQDLRNNALDKVSNPGEMSAFLGSVGLSDLIDGTVSMDSVSLQV